MRTKTNILKTITIIYNHNLKKNKKHIYTAKHINIAIINQKEEHKQQNQDQNKK